MSFAEYVKKGGGTVRVQGGERVPSMGRDQAPAPSERAGEVTTSQGPNVTARIFGISNKVSPRGAPRRGVSAGRNHCVRQIRRANPRSRHAAPPPPPRLPPVQVTRFRRLVDAIGGPGDTATHRKTLQTVSEEIVQDAEHASAAVRAAGAGPHSASQARLAGDLRGVLRDFREAQQLAVRWEREHAPKPDPVEEDARPGAPAGEEEQQRVALLQAERARSARLDAELEHREGLLEERDRGIREIQAQIGEVNEIFRDLAVLVNDQGQQLYDIESATMAAADGTKQAEGQLSRAARHHKKTCTYLSFSLLFVAMGLFALYVLLS